MQYRYDDGMIVYSPFTVQIKKRAVFLWKCGAFFLLSFPSLSHSLWFFGEADDEFAAAAVVGDELDGSFQAVD